MDVYGIFAKKNHTFLSIDILHFFALNIETSKEK